MSERPKLVLVDGSSYLYRAFHALPPLTNSRGEPTGAILGVLNMLQKLLKDEQPQFIAIVFDAPGKTFRDTLFEQYKANRTPMPDDLRPQIEPLLQIVQALGLPLLRVDGVEADDVIGCLARQAAEQHMKVVISTSDKDMAQLVNEDITLVNTMTGSVLDRAGVKVKFDVFPEQIIDYLALVGDSSDNIPGVPKVGPKTAAKWLAEYGTLDNLIANAAAVGGKVGENLRASFLEIELSRKLATIECKLELDLKPEMLGRGLPDENRLRELYTRWEMRAFLRQLSGEGAGIGSGGDLFAGGAGSAGTADAGSGGAASSGYLGAGSQSTIAGAASNPSTSGQSVAGHSAAGVLTLEAPPQPPPPQHYETILSWEAFDRWLERLQSAEVIAFDTQTTAPDYMQAELVGVAFAVAPGEAAYVPLKHDYPEAPVQLELHEVLRRLKPLLEAERPAKLGHDLKYDAHVLHRYDIKLLGHSRGGRYDSMLESYIWNSTVVRHDIDGAALRYLGRQPIPYQQVVGKGAKQIAFNQANLEPAGVYAAQEADMTLQLHGKFWPLLQSEPKLRVLYEQTEQPLADVLLHMERTGVLLDADLLRRQSSELGLRMHDIQARAHLVAGGPFNIESPKQLQEILFTKLALPVIRKTPTGQPSTAEDVLEEMAAEYELPRLILDYRGMAKLKSTYTEKLPRQVNPQTGRVHTSYNQAVAATGRLSSTDPNLQNIPIRTAEGRRIRQAFIAPPGYVLLAADYSQIELRIMAHLSEDPRLLLAFSEDRDIHLATAAEILNLSPDVVTAEQRRSAKAVNFGLIYGMSAFGLARQLGIERAEAQKYVQLYFDRYPGVKRYMDETREQARTIGYVETVYGRRLYLPDIRARNAAIRQYAERSAINAPMQGTAADIIKRAMITVNRWLTDSKIDARLVMQVHDELVFEVAESSVEPISQHIRELMCGASKLSVPLKVDIGTGANWDEAH